MLRGEILSALPHAAAYELGKRVASRHFSRPGPVAARAVAPAFLLHALLHDLHAQQLYTRRGVKRLSCCNGAQ